MNGLVDEVLRGVAADPHDSHRPAFIDCSADGTPPKTTSYAAWDAAADAACAWLRGRGVGRGDRVCLLLPNSATYPALYMGAARLGAITSGMNPRLGPAEVGWIVERSEPAVVITDETSHALVPAGISPVVLASEIDLTPGDGRPDVTVEGRDPADLVAIVWTSGTTGRPKGACFAHTHLAAVAAAQGDLTLRHDRYLSAIPYAHVGFMSKLWGNLSMATTQVIAPGRWTAPGALALIAGHAITVAGGVPTQWRMMLDHPDFVSTDLSSVRQVVLGGAAADPALVREITERVGCPVVSRYTCTEAAITTGTAPDAPPEVAATTVGKPVTGVEVRLVDSEHTPVAVGEVGEVQCRSGAVMRGYWRDAAATAEVLSEDGWLSTGDLGRLGEDANLRIVGRRKEMFVRGGYNVYPVEVESRLCEHPDVRQAAVVGVPDRRLGEIGVAFVVAASPEVVPDGEELRHFCKAALASYKAPDRVVVVDELPLTPMNKVDKASLSARHLPAV